MKMDEIKKRTKVEMIVIASLFLLVGFTDGLADFVAQVIA